MSETIQQSHPVIDWEILPSNYILPDDPVESINHPLIASGLTDALEAEGLLNPSVLIASNFALCANVNGKIVVKGPDWVYIPLIKEILPNRRSYTPVTEGALPSIVMEFLSDTEGDEYSKRNAFPYGKWYFYEQILKVPIYVIFNGESGKFEVFGLESNRYQQRTPDDRGLYWIESMGLFLGRWEGEKANRNGFWLRWWNESGEMLLWSSERSVLEKKRADLERQQARSEEQRANQALQQAETERQRAEAEWQRAEAERQRAETERQRAEAAEQEIALLRQRLQALSMNQ